MLYCVFCAPDMAPPILEVWWASWRTGSMLEHNMPCNIGSGRAWKPHSLHSDFVVAANILFVQLVFFFLLSLICYVICYLSPMPATRCDWHNNGSRMRAFSAHSPIFWTQIWARIISACLDMLILPIFFLSALYGLCKWICIIQVIQFHYAKTHIFVFILYYWNLYRRVDTLVVKLFKNKYNNDRLGVAWHALWLSMIHTL